MSQSISEPNNEAQALLSSPRFLAAQRELLETIASASARLREVRPQPSSPEIRAAYLETIREFQVDRGRELYFPFLASGLGAGPFVELLDGSVKYDMITGIGVNFFGHSHPALMEEMIRAVSADTMQGNLEPGIESRRLLRALLSKVSGNSRLKHAWLMCSGTMSNEVALKIIRQKKAPATRVFAFENCFAGRSTAMQEITDSPGYRQGQPVYGEVEYLPFYDPKAGLERSLEIVLGHLEFTVARYPGKFAALMMELVQGEGGFNHAPREFYVRLFEKAKSLNLAIWADEIQTFGRTGEYFAFQKFGLGEWIDVVTFGKMLQACGLLYTEEYNPKPGLVAGTFSGSTVALRTAVRTLRLLDEEGFLGPEGKIEKLSARFSGNLKKIGQSRPGTVGEVRAIGGMIAFEPFGGKMEDVKATLLKLFDLGVVAFYCGHGPYLVRMLPPLGAMTEADVDQVSGLIERALVEVKK